MVRHVAHELDILTVGVEGEHPHTNSNPALAWPDGQAGAAEIEANLAN